MPSPHRARRTDLSATRLLLAVGLAAGVAACADEAEEPGEPTTSESTAPDEGEEVDQAPEPANDDTAAVPAVEEVATGLDDPWGLAFLPDGERVLVTQLGGALALVDTTSGEVTDIAGVPEVSTEGQGGLLDVAVDPDLDPDEGGGIYLTYAGTVDGGQATHLARARLDLDAAELEEVEELFVADPVVDSGQHFGSRVEVGPGGHLHVSVGDRGDKDFDDHVSQDTSHTLGSVVRLDPDGAVPDDNPFVDDADVADELFTFGHRNVQGMAVHPDTGEIWVSEHGEEDGDSLAVLEPGGNHGWPIAHTGCEYGTDTPVGDDPFEVDEVVSPAFVWECGSGGFPPAGMTFYDGDAFPDWEGSLLVAGLGTEELARFEVDGDEVELAETLVDDQGWRIRDVAVGPDDGAIYLAIDGSDVPLLRLVPDTAG